jgi:hypothetical protein
MRRTSGASTRRVDHGLKALPRPLAPSNTKARMFRRSIPMEALLWRSAASQEHKASQGRRYADIISYFQEGAAL